MIVVGVRSRRGYGGVHPRGLREQAQRGEEGAEAAAAAADAAGGGQPRRVPAGAGEPEGADANRRVAVVQRQIPNCDRAAVAAGRGGGCCCWWLAVGASPPLRLPQALLAGCRRDTRASVVIHSYVRGMSSVQPRLSPTIVTPNTRPIHLFFG